VPGEDWELMIRGAVRASDVVLVCLSRASVTICGFVQKEIKLALDVANEQPEGTVHRSG
jgi:DNA polymerase sigma